METKVLNYRIIIEPEKYPDGSQGYNAYCPSLGVADYGDSIEKVLESIKDGIKLALEHLASHKEEIPIDQLEQQIIASTYVHISALETTGVSRYEGVFPKSS